MRDPRAMIYCAAGLELTQTRDALASGVRGLSAIFLEESIEAAIDDACNLAQGQFAQRDEISGPKKMGQRALGAVHRIHVAPLHSLLQRLRREIG